MDITECDDIVTYCDVCECDECPRMGDDCDGKPLEDDDEIEPLERTSEHTAIPVRECIYPRCEECDDYHGHYCTVPMVISKQIYRTVQERMRKMEESIAWLEKAVTDEILGEREVTR